MANLVDCDQNHARGFVAVHVGAGYHSPANSDMYKDVCRQACLQAIQLLKARKSAMEAVVQAVTVLENSPCTNAGLGSNLTVDGTVECDASIMDGRSYHYGAVGALSGVQNPILVAGDLLENQLHGKMSLGRIPPSTLVGHGALEWAVKKSIPTLDNKTLVTASSQKAYVKYKRKLDRVEGESPSNHKSYKHRRISNPADKEKPEMNGVDGTIDGHLLGMTPVGENLQAEPSDELKDRLLDTVGAIVVDDTGRMVSAVSSGGIVLKQPGRVGQAALYGCGCWAENDDDNHTAVGVSTTGCGEHLTKALLAKECADDLLNQPNPTTSLNEVFQKKFLGSRYLKNVGTKLGGVIALKLDASDNQKPEAVEVLWAHTTDSMCLGFMSTKENQPQALVSRLPENSKCGKSCVVQSKCYSLQES